MARIFSMFSLALFLIMSGFACSKIQQKSEVVKVLATTGNSIRIIRSDKDLVPTVNLAIQSSDIIVTGQDSTVSLLISEKGIMKVSANSTLAMKELVKDSRTTLNLKSGRVFCLLNKLKKDESFEVQTITAVVGVRGTTFSVDSEEKKITIEVLTGTVKAMDINKTENSKDVTRFQKGIITDGKINEMKISDLKKTEVTTFISQSGQEGLSSQPSLEPVAAELEQVQKDAQTLKDESPKSEPIKTEPVKQKSAPKW